MKITLAETAGFCFGVDRAVNMVYSLLDEGEKVCTLGPIIHNPQVVDDLKARGVTIAETPEQAPADAVLVVRTHGVSKAVMDEIGRRSLTCANATCPFVQKIHKIVSDATVNGSTVLIAGDPNHPEVIGIKGHCHGETYVFRDLAELEKIIAAHPELAQKSLCAVAQTTFSVQQWQKCVKKIKLVYTNAVVFDTICNATEERQAEAVKLSRECDRMLIIGGRQSSNTAKLKSVCEQNCPTDLIETAEELHTIDFTGCRHLGVTAGASTPARIIKEVLETMSEIIHETNSAVEPNTAAPQETEKEEAAKSFDEMSFSEALEESLKSMNSDQKVHGVVVGISPSEIQVDINRKHAGYIPLSEYSNDPNVDPLQEVKIGDEMDLIIMKTNDAEGTVMLSKRRYDATKSWDEIVKANEENAILEGTVTDVVRGGVLADVQGSRVFIPASLATASRNDPLEDLLKQKVQFHIIDIDKRRRRAVGSVRAVLREQRKELEDKFWEQAEIGQKYTGTVKSLTSYGAFVDIGGVDGMIHISELSWSRIKHPSEVVNVGDTVEVYIKDLDPEKRKISLGFKKAEDNPWEILRRDYPVDTVVEAKIVGLTAFGAFAQIIPGIDGLIHISQLADRRVEKPQDVVKVGDVVKAKITEIDFEKKRVSLSMRALIEDGAAEADEAEDAE